MKPIKGNASVSGGSGNLLNCIQVEIILCKVEKMMAREVKFETNRIHHIVRHLNYQRNL